MFKNIKVALRIIAILGISGSAIALFITDSQLNIGICAIIIMII